MRRRSVAVAAAAMIGVIGLTGLTGCAKLTDAEFTWCAYHRDEVR